ncbi:hypothetical protein HDV64DRAFT_116555 [Trichoderma sp. TUCIM 5745]
MRSLRGTVLPLGPRLGAAVAVLGLLSRPAALPVAAATTAPPAMKLWNLGRQMRLKAIGRSPNRQKSFSPCISIGCF